MALTRRQFLSIVGGSAAGAVVFQACGVPPSELFVQSPNQMPEDLATGLDNWYATLCRQCPNSEGIVVRVMEGRAKKVEGNVDYPVNTGKHGVRCEGGLQTVYNPDRVRGPLVRVGERGSGEFREISWDDAIKRVSLQLGKLSGRRNQEKVVLVTDPISGHLGMVADKFASTIGAQRMSYEPLEETAQMASIKQMFGQDTMPVFDIANAGAIISFGADWLNTWLSPVQFSRGYGEFRQGDRERGTFIHVDSRFSMTAANADKWVYVKPGTEGFLALSIAHELVEGGHADRSVAEDLFGSAEFLNTYAPANVAGKVGVTAEKIHEVAEMFATHGPGLAFGGGSAAAHTNGSFNLTAIYALNYLMGSVGKKGGIQFNPGPAISGIASAPTHTSFDDWKKLVGKMKDHEVEVLMVRGANPMHGLPEDLGFRDASYEVPFIFSFASVLDDTAKMSDLVLPEHTYLEDWGSDTPNPGPGYQVVGFQQPVVRPFYEDRGDELGTRGFGDTLMMIATEMGVDLGLPGETFLEVVQDGARQLYESGRGTAGTDSTSSYPDFETFWVGALQNGFWRDESAGSTDSVPNAPRISEPREPEFDGTHQFHLIPFASTGLGDGKHSHLPWMQSVTDPITTAAWRTWVEINIRTAQQMGLKEGDVVQVSSSHGTIEALAYPHPGISPDVVAIPTGQGHDGNGRYADGRGSNVYSILSPKSNSETGELAWAATKVSVARTGEWIRLPKFENTGAGIPRDEEQAFLEITSEDS